MEEFSAYITEYSQLVIDFAPKILLAIATLIIGFWVANKITGIVIKALEKSRIESKELQTFLGSILRIGIKILVIISVAGIVGIETTSFVGIIAAMSFAVGLALQGNLSNFAAGVMLLITRPFKVGDEVKINGKWMFVREIQIFHTIFRNFDNSFTIIPNSSITSGPVQNLTAQDIRKLSIAVHIPYTENFERVKEIIFEAGARVKDAKPDFCFIDGMKDHYSQASFIFAIPKERYWYTEGPLKQAIIDALYENKIQVAYPTGVVIGYAGPQTDSSTNSRNPQTSLAN